MDLDRWWPGFLADQTQIRDRLVAAYDDPRRGYHDLRHLTEVFARLDELSDDLSDDLLLAVWFHDAVYESGTSAGDGNEARSAMMAERELATVDAPPMLVDEVARLVRLSEHHRPGAEDLNGRLLCDADLAILAADGDRYADYVAGVRSEYADVPDEMFRAGRLTVLQGLLDKEHLFESARARELWEARARANLTTEVTALSAAS